MTRPILVWFRRDLRLADHPALAAAAGSGAPVLPVFVLDQETGERPLGGAARWWLDGSLKALAADLAARGTPLIVRQGAAATQILELARAVGAAAVYWNRGYDGPTVARDTALKQTLIANGIAARSFAGSLLAEPWTLKTQAGQPYQVFTPFWRSLRTQPIPPPLAAPERLIPLTDPPPSDPIASLCLLPTRPDWAGGLRATWVPGESAARADLAQFLDQGLSGYAGSRDRPDQGTTSRLSPRLAWGEISARQIWHAVGGAAAATLDGERLLSELGWRDFAYHVLFHHPDLAEQPLRAAFRAFPWQPDPRRFKAWTEGRTGFPLVDAGMRQLWHTGWMHNRVRMVAASFLVKHLLQPWTDGEAWFWDTLVDADVAANPFNWQWIAGCGADAAPYFRIFNPTLQARKFDPDGAYVRRWIPELADLPTSALHQPWTQPVMLRQSRSAGMKAAYRAVYETPIVDHDTARAQALAAFATLTGSP